MADLHVLIVAEDPLVRSGLALLLASDPGVSGVTPAAPSQVQGLLERHPSAAIVDLGPGPAPELAAVRSISRALPVLALASDASAAADALAAGARAVLPREVPKARLVAALRAAVEGLLVADASWSGALLRQRRVREPASEPLTPRELEVLQLLSDGLSNKAIADRLGISEHTAKFHVNAILGKLGAQGRTDAVVRGARLGLVVL